MGLFVFALILVLIGLGIFAVGHVKTEEFGDIHFRWVGVLPILLGVILIFAAMYKPVGAREVGIPETFGHLGTDLQPGAHFVSPWTVLHKCSLAQQQSILTQAPSEGDKQGGDGVLVNGSDQGQGTADVFVTYHFDPLHAEELYKKYGCDEERIKSNLIRPATKNVIPATAAQYASLDLKAKRSEISTASTPKMQSIVAKDGILIDNVLISELVLSKPTQDAADAKLAAQQAAQQAEFARQKQETDNKTIALKATADKLSNDTRTASLTPVVLCAQWIEMLKEAKPASIFVNGPCGGTSVTPSSVIVNQSTAGK